MKKDIAYSWKDKRNCRERWIVIFTSIEIWPGHNLLWLNVYLYYLELLQLLPCIWMEIFKIRTKNVVQIIPTGFKTRHGTAASSFIQKRCNCHIHSELHWCYFKSALVKPITKHVSAVHILHLEQSYAYVWALNSVWILYLVRSALCNAVHVDFFYLVITQLYGKNIRCSKWQSKEASANAPALHRKACNIKLKTNTYIYRYYLAAYFETTVWSKQRHCKGLALRFQAERV